VSSINRSTNNFAKTTWWAFNAFLILFPLSDGVRMFTKFPPGSFNLIVLTVFATFLLVTESAAYTYRHIYRPRNVHLDTGHTVQKRWRATRAEWLLAIYLLLSVLATVHSVNFHLSLVGLPEEYGGIIPLVSYAILFLWVSRRIRPTQRPFMIRSIVIGSIVPTFYGILQHIHVSQHPQVMGTRVLNFLHVDYMTRSVSLFTNADFFGTYMALVMVLTLTLYIRSKSRLHTFSYLVLIAGQFFAITFSSTRSAWLAWVVGTVIVVVLSLRQNSRVWKRLTILAIVLIACFVIINHQSHNQVASRASSIGTNAVQIVTNHHSNYAGSSRWYIWKESIPLMAKHPLFGTGPDTFEQVFQPPSTGAEKYLGGQPMANANNAYIQAAVTLGLPALVVLILFYGFALVAGWRELKTSRQDTYFESIGIFATVIGYLVQAIFNMDVITVAPLFWVLLGSQQLTQAVGRIGRRNVTH
jgi:O-antigen ligase